MSDEENKDSLVSEDRAKYNHTSAELDRLGGVLVEAEEIKSDDKLYRLVQGRMGEKAERMTSIADLRSRLADDELEENAKK